MRHTASEVAVERTLECDENASVSRIFDVLADERRRVLLDVLLDQTTPIDAATLARHVAAHTEAVSPGAVDPAVVEEIHLSLHHIHLPKMAQAGLVTFDPNAGVVRDATFQSTD